MTGITPALLKKWKFDKPVRGLKVTCVGRHQYHVTSQSRPEIEHMVDTEGEFPRCSCESATLGQALLCPHIRRVGLFAEAGLLPKQQQKDKR